MGGDKNQLFQNPENEPDYWSLLLKKNQQNIGKTGKLYGIFNLFYSHFPLSSFIVDLKTNNKSNSLAVTGESIKGLKSPKTKTLENCYYTTSMQCKQKVKT